MSAALHKLLLSLEAHPVINPEISYSDYVSLDLSVHNKELDSINVSSPEGIQAYINFQLKKAKAKIAFGGYLEQRSIYHRSSYFKNENTEEERNIHLGMDLWLSAGSSVYAPLDGLVHSFKNNTNFGDYGPTIILQHKIDSLSFYTLYGHLSLQSLQHLKTGEYITKGQHIATLGDSSINGNYAPHLHFQIIQNLGNIKGDYPGVCSQKDLAFYKDNCPNPNFLLKID